MPKLIKHLLRKLFFPYPSEDWGYMWRRCLAAIELNQIPAKGK